MVEAHPLILSLRSAGLRDVDPSNIDEVHTMWQAFSKAKNCIDGGDRFEYLSWRLYSREVLLRYQMQSGKRQDTPLNPSPMAADAGSGEVAFDEESSSAASSEWESDVESESSNSDNTESKESPLTAMSAAQSTNTDSRTRTSLIGRPQRRISSLELQNLFREARTVCSSATAKNADLGAPIDDPHIHIVKSCLKKSSSTSPQHSDSIQHARFASPQLQHTGSESRVTSRSLEKATIPSSVVRGFSPSNVSVRVSNKPESQESPQNKEPSFTQKHFPDSIPSPAADSNQIAKMFYICAADSDTESSNMGSPDCPPRADKGPKLKGLQPKSSDLSKDLGPGPSESDAAEEDPEEDKAAASGFEAASNDTSDWDDITDEEDEPEDKESTERDMFKERAVPTKPLLKRSLLSSLFVNKVSTPPDREEHATTDGKDSPVSAPVDILLGAPLAPHFPLPVETCADWEGGCEWEGANIIGGGIMGQREQEQHQQHIARSYESEIPNSESSRERPYMIGSVREPEDLDGVDSDYSVQSGWANQHEDIYDPMNYHSRGW